MAAMDVFNGDAFTLQSLTTAINSTEYEPMFMQSLGIFTPNPIRTDKFSIESRDGVLSLIQTSERGAPLDQRTTEKRTIRDFRTRRIAKGDTVRADEIQGIRAFGTENELMAVESEIMRRMNGPVGLMADVRLTWENMMLGAVQGIVSDADASVLYNWFTELGVTQPAEVDFDLDNANPASGAIRKKCTAVVRAILKAMKGLPAPREIVGLCGDNFFDDFTASAEVRATYLNQQAAAELRGGLAYESVRYGGINHINYRGTDDGSTVAIGTDKCKYFPVSPGAFEMALSPMESFEYANTPGLPMYAMIVRDLERNMWVKPEVYSYPMFYPTRPLTLQSARRT